MSNINASAMMAQMRVLSAQAAAKATQTTTVAPSSGENKPGGFSDLLKQSIEKVNETQQETGKLKESFEKGDPDVSLNQVMVAVQKADISFQAMTQVRNKLVSAYQDIMNTHV